MVEEPSVIDTMKCKNCKSLVIDENSDCRCIEFGKKTTLEYTCPRFEEGENEYQKELKKLEKKKEDDIDLTNLKEYFEKGVPKIEYILDPFIRKGGITIIGGEPGTKKSLLSMLISLCICKGEKLFDKFEVKKGKVIYLDYENGEIVLVNRFHSLLYGNFKGNKKDTENILLSVFDDLKLDGPDTIEKLYKIDEKYNPDIYIFDSLVRCMEGDEDKSTDVRKVFDNLKYFMSKGKSIIILHHTNKSKQKGMNALRGSSDLGGMAEIVMMLESSNNFTYVKLVKHRHLGLESTENWGFMIDDTIFKDSEKFLKLKYFESNPDDKDAITKCFEDFKDWLNRTYSSNDEIRSNKILESMDKHYGHKKNTVYKALDIAVNERFIEKTVKRGIWVVL